MIPHFSEDQFGLFHACLPHPHEARDVQVMVLEMERRWCAYVDGVRVTQTFPSRRHAESAAIRLVRALPSPTTYIATYATPHRSGGYRLLVGMAIAVCVAMLFGVGVSVILAFDERGGPTQTITPVVNTPIDDPQGPATAAQALAVPEPTPVSTDAWERVAYPIIPNVNPVSKQRLRPRRIQRYRRVRRTRARRARRQPDVWGKDIQMPYRD